ncbi:hypothetical protein SNEBB_006280, partial [Seison nebaliae]
KIRLREHIKMQPKTIEELKIYIKPEPAAAVCSFKIDSMGIRCAKFIDRIWLPYTELLKDLKLIPFDVIGVDISHEYELKISKIANENIIQLKFGPNNL